MRESPHRERRDRLILDRGVVNTRIGIVNTRIGIVNAEIGSS